jgi:hypothetical protein
MWAGLCRTDEIAFLQVEQNEPLFSHIADRYFGPSRPICCQRVIKVSDDLGASVVTSPR